MRFRMPSQWDLWRQIRRKMIRETSLFLSEGMRRPDLAVSIPICVAGKATFSKAFAEEFWRQVFDESASEP